MTSGSAATEAMSPYCASLPWRPPQQFRRAEAKRLAVALLLALGLHILMFGLLKSPRKSFQPAASPLVVQWMRWASAPPRRLPAEPDRAVDRSSSGIRHHEIDRRDRQVHRAPISFAADGAASDTPTAASDREARQGPAAAELIESARTIAREMAHEHTQGQAANAVQADRPFLPALDRALRKAEVGEERLASGLIRITTKSGRVYCLTPPPDMARDGPLAMMSTPTNCP